MARDVFYRQRSLGARHLYEVQLSRRRHLYETQPSRRRHRTVKKIQRDVNRVDENQTETKELPMLARSALKCARAFRRAKLEASRNTTRKEKIRKESKREKAKY